MSKDARRDQRLKQPKKEKLFAPNWRTISGSPVGGHYYDAFNSQPEPTMNDLARAFTDTVYACGSLIANKVSTTPIRLYVKTIQGQPRPKCQGVRVSRKTLDRLTRTKRLPNLTLVEEVTDHPLDRLLDRGNDFHNRLDLLWLTSAYQDTTGNAFWLLVFDEYDCIKIDGEERRKPSEGAVPIGINILPSQAVWAERDEELTVKEWRYGEGMNSKKYFTEEIIHFKHNNLLDPYVMGSSPLRAAWSRVQIGFKELGFLDATLSNNARPDAILTPGENISPFESERLAKEFSQRFAKGGNGGVMVADGPMDLKFLSPPPKDLAELQLYQVIKTQVCNVYGVPPDLWELGESNRATADAALYSLAVHCLKPRLDKLVEKLNERLVPYFSDRLFFEADECIPEDRQFELTRLDTLGKLGAISRNEIRAYSGFDNQDWAKPPLLPSGMMLAPDPSQATPDTEPYTIPPTQEEINSRSQQIAALQTAVHTGTMSRTAAIANASLTFSLTEEQVNALFPPEVVHEQAKPGPTSNEPTDDEAKTPEQAPATASNDLRATVGGSVAVADLQRSYYRGELAREACVANATLIFGFTPEEAETLFPDKAPQPPGGPPQEDKPSEPNKPEDNPAKPSGESVAAPKAKAFRLDDPNHEPLEKAVKAFFARQATAAFSHFKSLKRKALPAEGWFDIDAWTEEMARELMPIVRVYYDDASKKTITELGGSPDLFSVVQPNLSEGIAKATFLFCHETNQTTSLELNSALSALKDSLLQGVTQGDVRNELMNRVKAVFDTAENSRAFQIAVTESSRAQHAALEITAQGTGLAKAKRWILSDDACPICLPLSGKVVAMGENFETRGEGPYSDIPYPPAHPRCRCTMSPVIAGTND